MFAQHVALDSIPSTVAGEMEKRHTWCLSWYNAQSRYVILNKKNVLFFVGLIISLQLFRGDMEQIRRENPMIFNRGLAITRKLGFPDVIMPGRKNYLGMGKEMA